MKTREILIATRSPAPDYEYTSLHIAKLRLALSRFWLAHWHLQAESCFVPGDTLGIWGSNELPFLLKAALRLSFVSSDTPAPQSCT